MNKPVLTVRCYKCGRSKSEAVSLGYDIKKILRHIDFYAVKAGFLCAECFTKDGLNQSVND